MKLFAFVTVLAAVIASVIGQTIELGYPTNGAVLKRGQNFATQVILPGSLQFTYQIGIALSVNSCNNGVCPQPSTNGLGEVLYNGPWTPTAHAPGGFYQNFTVQVATSMPTGPAVFMLTHAGAIGAGPFAFLEYRTANVTLA